MVDFDNRINFADGGLFDEIQDDEREVNSLSLIVYSQLQVTSYKLQVTSYH